MTGSPDVPPNNATNNDGATFDGPPNIPHLITNDTKDTLFFSLSGTRSTSPVNDYATVPTAAGSGWRFQRSHEQRQPGRHLRPDYRTAFQQ